MSDTQCPLGCNAPALTVYHLSRFDVVRCSNCGILARNPLPDDAELHALYESEHYHESAYFSGQLTGGDLERRPEVRIYREALARMFPAPRQAKPRLLDIGCGTGLFLALARDSGFDVEGIEISERLSELAQSHYGVPVTCGEFSSITLREAAYDVITMWDLLEHVVDPVAVIRRCRALLRPGGRVVIFTIDSSSLFNAIGDLGYRLSGKSWTRPLELLYDARHNYYFTPETLDTVLARGGLHATARTSHRAYLGRWLSEPASPLIRLGGSIIDAISVVVDRQYRQLVYCQTA